ncbi:MAG: M1 family peptidase, partial [Calditrichaeota bacterium]
MVVNYSGMYGNKTGKMHLTCMIILLLGVVPNFYAQDNVVNYWQQYVHYTIDVTLDTTYHALQGYEKIIYKNQSPDTLHNFYLHLYPNAFNDPNSTVAREAKKFYLYREIPQKDRGYIAIKTLKILSLNGKTSDLPIGAYYVEDTILRLTLPEPLPPGGSLVVEINFYEKIRKLIAVSGYSEGQYDMGQWYPKVVVYDENGWNREPLHLFGGDYGEFGTYDVTIHLPANFIVAATGVVVKGDPGWDRVQVDTSLGEDAWQKHYRNIKQQLTQEARQNGFKAVTFHAENVHDFAWTASPNFIYEKGAWRGIPIHVLYREQSKKQWGKVVVERARQTLQWLENKFGPYPYPQVTITQAIKYGREYPMLVMNGSSGERTVAHQLGHLYFYAAVSNNEHREPWLDEGLVTFQTQWYMESKYGPLGYNKKELLKRLPMLFKLYPLPGIREIATTFTNRYLHSGHNEPIAKASSEFKDIMGFGMNAYLKGAFFFDMLKYVVGDSTFEAICHEYFRRWKFKHVNEHRFKQVCEEVSGQKLDWFFNEWLHDTPTVEYGLAGVKKIKQPDGTWRTEVKIQRRAKGVMPVEVVLETGEGEKIIKRWAGRELTGLVVFETREKPGHVEIDPRDRILDNNRLNNGGSRFKFHFDLPMLNLYYAPRNAYLILWRPYLETNTIDRLRIGLRLRGSYLRDYLNLTLGIWYGFKSRELDGLFGFSHPLKSLGARTRYDISIQKIEGRFIANGHLAFRFSKNLTTPPVHLI